jgi:hypothetical protein
MMIQILIKKNFDFRGGGKGGEREVRGQAKKKEE